MASEWQAFDGAKQAFDTGEQPRDKAEQLSDIAGARALLSCAKQDDTDMANTMIGLLAHRGAGCGVCTTDLGYFYDGIATTSSRPLARK